MTATMAIVAPALIGLAAILALAVLTWVVSVVRHDVSLVDRLWSVFIATAAIVYAALLPGSLRATVMLVLVIAWSVRLCFYITRRNWGHGEDRRYHEIRARNEPGFAFKSLYLVFALQALLAWLVSAPFLFGIGGTVAFGVLDVIGAALAAFGIVFEAIGDAQMASFKGDSANRGQVMDRGLWRYTRHPNYFGECCVWWGLFLMALAAGGGLAAISPLIMTVLLLKVSGVSLLEKDIAERRPAYRDYVARTNAFFPGPPRRKA
jgi:steroid 5-alpha reductase family enzyme